MSYLQTLRSYCRPAQIYLAISAFTTLILFIQNCRDSNSFTCGIFKVKTPVSNTFYFVFQVLFTLGWAWFLNYMCRKGWSTVSWLLVILLVIGMLIKMYYINIQGLSRTQFRSMLESSNTLPNNDIERFCSACPASDPNCPRCDDELQEGEEKFTNGGCGNNEESSCPKPETPEEEYYDPALNYDPLMDQVRAKNIFVQQLLQIPRYYILSFYTNKKILPIDRFLICMKNIFLNV